MTVPTAEKLQTAESIAEVTDAVLQVVSPKSLESFMPVVYLQEEEVQQLLTMSSVVDVIEEAFRQLGARNATNVPRKRARGDKVVLHSMSASADFVGLVGCKVYTTSRQGTHFHVLLYDAESGEMVGMIQANHLGRLRTGAATAVAAQWMALPEAKVLGIFGAGYQAETQLEAMLVVRKIHRVFVYSRNPQKRQEFAQRMSERFEIEVTPADRPQEVVEDVPMIITATTAKSPVFDGTWLEEGSFVAAVGSNALNRAEIDAVAVRRADTIVCDSVEAARKEAGDFTDAIERGSFDWGKAANLCDVVVGRASGRFQPESITIFKSVGLAIEDIALGAKLLQLARENGFGTQYNL